MTSITLNDLTKETETALTRSSKQLEQFHGGMKWGRGHQSADVQDCRDSRTVMGVTFCKVLGNWAAV